VDGDTARDRTFDVIRGETSRRARGHTDEGIVLIEPTGNVLWWSPAMNKALERAGARWWRGMRCCEAFGCGDDCLTVRTLGTGGEPEARHWRAGAGVDAAITARPIRSRGQELVVVEVRFLAATMAALEAPVRDVRVSALGSLSVTVGGRSRDGDWLQQRPGQVFRYLLASRASAQRSEAIASALWPDRGPSAVANVRYCIFKLREQLADSGDPAGSLVVRDAAGYRIDLRRVELDVDRFQEKTNAGIAAQRRGESSVAEPMLVEAMALYRGDFLGDDPYADWAFSEREYLRSMAGKDLAALAQIGLSGGRLVSAAEHLQRLAQLEPFDSHVHQMLIEVCLRRGRRTEALRHYHALRARLHRAFGEQPDFDLTSLAAGLAVRQRERRDLSQRIAAPNLMPDAR
jgi:DNA-binding SARP family transcriptional activator